MLLHFLFDLGSREDLLRKNEFRLASFYERIAEFDKAAALFSSYYETYPDAKDAPDALYNAGLHYQGLGELDTAISKYQTYVTDLDAKDELDVYWTICQLHENKKDWKAAAQCFNDVRTKYKKASQAKVFESRYRYALALEKLGKGKDATKEYQWLVKAYPKLDAKDKKASGAQLAGAHAQFELLEPELDAFLAKKITRLSKKALFGKLEGAEELACASEKCKKRGKLLSVLDYGNGDYGICALTRVGQVYRNVADTIRGAPTPRNLDFEQQEMYRAELDSLALGPETKGLEAFESALQKAYELNIYNDCTLTAQANLKELNPNMFPELQKRGFRGAEGFITAGPMTGIEVAEVAPAATTPGAETLQETSAEAEASAGASE